MVSHSKASSWASDAREGEAVPGLRCRTGVCPVDDVFGALRARQARGTDSSGVVGKRGVAKARHFGFDADTVQTTAGTVKPLELGKVSHQ